MNTELHVNEIAKKGYTILKSEITGSMCDLILNKIKKLHLNQNEVIKNSKVPFLNQGHDMVYNIQNKDLDILKIFLRTQKINQILIQCLNDQWYKGIPKEEPNYILRSMLARSGGSERMPLHIDSFIPNSGKLSWSIQAAIILEDQNIENGCTIVVPGSHLFDRYANQEAVKDSFPIISQKGDIVIWDSRLWHGTNPNSSNKSRWSLISTYGRWWLKQNYDIPKALPKSFLKELSDSEKAVLGFCSIPPIDETERVDIKGGYELIPH